MGTSMDTSRRPHEGAGVFKQLYWSACRKDILAHFLAVFSILTHKLGSFGLDLYLFQSTYLPALV